MAEKAKNKIIVLEPSTKSVTDLLALAAEKDVGEILKAASIDEALQLITASLPCLFIVSILDNNTVPASVQLLKRLETSIKQHGLKVYMVTGIKNRQLADLFTQKMGVTDYIVDPVPTRTMFFKVNLAIKAVENFRKQAEIKKAQQEQIVIKKFEGKKVDAAPGAEVAAKGKPALQMAEDTFLFKNGGAKKVGKKFVLEVEGPDPSTGEWQQHADKGDAKSAWRWVPNEEKEAQASGAAPPDGWVAEGEKPAFNEETGKWALASENPALGLKKAGKTVAEKISLDEKGELVIADDSPAAEANLQKNRVKAAAAIKQREEKQKILAEKKSAIEKNALAEVKGSILKEIAEGEDDETKVPAGVKPPADKAGTLKKSSGKGKSGALEELMNTVDADESDEPTEFNNRLDGKKEQLRAVADKRDVSQVKESGAILEPDEKAIPAAEAKKASPLDFLKKKKEQLQQASLAQGVNTIKADAGPKGANALKDSEEAAGPSAGVLNRKKASKKSPAADRLAQLKAGLEEGEEETGEDDSAFASLGGEEQGEEGPAFNNSTGKPGEQKRGSPQLKLKDSEKPVDRGSPRLKLQAKKKKALDALQEKLDEPIPEEMSPEEEEEIREELGLEGRPEIKVKELARKKRQAEVDRMKGLLAEIDEEIEEAGEAISGDDVTEEEEKGGVRRRGDLTAEKLKGIRGAIDSGSETAEEEEEEALKRKKSGSGEEKKSRKSLEDEARYMPEAELLPLGNAWENAGEHFAYVSADVRYKGFGKLEDILPLWVFHGDQVPELLDKSKQWRFYGPLPLHAKTVAEVPSDVRDYLLGLRDQLKANGVGVEESAALGKAADPKDRKAKGKKDSASSSLDRLRAQLSEEEDSSEDEENSSASEGEENSEAEDLTATKGKYKAGGELTLPGEELDGLKARKSKSSADTPAEEEETETQAADAEDEEGRAKGKGIKGKKNKKGAGAAGLDMLARLRDKMAEAEPEAEEEEAAGDKEKTRAGDIEEDPKSEFTRAEEDPGNDKLSALRSKLAIDEEADDADSEIISKKKKKADSDAGEENTEEESLSKSDLRGARESKDAEAKKAASAMDRLRGKLGMDEPAEEESAETAADFSDSPEKGKDHGSATDSGPDATGLFTTEGGVRLPASEAVRKFMERRKNKATKEAMERAGKADPSTPPATVYLGIYVSLSDSLAQEKDCGVAVPRVLKAFEESYGDCAALCTGIPEADNFAEVRFSAPSSPEALTRVQLNSGIFEPITPDDGGSDDLLGYLFLQAKGARSVFSEAERSTLKRIARKLWPILKRSAVDQESEAA